MDATELRALQAPLKQKYRDDPETARIHAHAEVRLDPANIAASIAGDAPRIAGLHPAAGGDGSLACSGDMLLEALAACAGVTLCAVATAMGANLTGGKIIAEGHWDARGTLGIDRSAPVGVTDVTLHFDLEGDLDAKTRTRLVDMTERYCVILATLREPPKVTVAEPELT